MELDGKVALVTGAGSGIGRATALLLARRGAQVGLVARHREDLAEVAGEIAAGGGRGVVLTADISREDEIEAAVSELVRQAGRLDIVVANAGVNGTWAPVDELTLEEWNHTVGINLTGTFLTLRTAIPHLKRAGAGSIVIVASVNGTRVFSNAGATAYSCTKAAQVALAKMSALELAPHRIRVNVVCPGWIETNIEVSTVKRHTEHLLTPVEFPEGKIPLTHGTPGRAEDVAEVIAFLSGDGARHVTGTPVWVDGAESLLQG